MVDQLLKHGAEVGQARCGDAGCTGGGQWFTEKGIQFEGHRVFKIDQRGGPIRAHDSGAITLVLTEVRREGMPQCAAGGDDFVHQLGDKLFPRAFVEQSVGGQARPDGLVRSQLAVE